MTSNLFENKLRVQISELLRADETDVVQNLVAASRLNESQREGIRIAAVSLVERCRQQRHRAGTLDSFLQEFGLSNKEGIALMCLAESLLRVPDEETADRLIAEKIASGDWASHQGRSDSSFVNASVWGLMLTGKIVSLDEDTVSDTSSWLKKVVNVLGEPVVRHAVLQAMRIMGGQFVLGRTIDEAIRKSREDESLGACFSFDMLGEGARTGEDSKRYFDSYAQAIDAICEKPGSDGLKTNNGISVKLSALHPRYEYRQKNRVLSELFPRLKQLALMAKKGDISFSIDAEEADRLDISLDVFEALARDPELTDWDGLGFVLQAYLKSATSIADWLVQLAKDSGRRLMVRLVKGAYWDGEIKHAQELGLRDYPVFTRKANTDLSYQICAQKLLANPREIYPQFATHNAHTVALIQALLKKGQSFEFQRLHGMGQLLYEQVTLDRSDIAVRVYAPVGNHKDLLPYLVRRLLENGANSSFVNRFLDAQVSPDELVQDPQLEIASVNSLRHGGIPLPRNIYDNEDRPWINSLGIDLSNSIDVDRLLEAVQSFKHGEFASSPMIGGQVNSGDSRQIHNPAKNKLVVGHVVESTTVHIETALELAAKAYFEWNSLGADSRAASLERAANLMETKLPELVSLLVAEAGRTIDDGVAEVREAVDFCRYYAQQGRVQFATPVLLPGPTGEENQLSYIGRGVFLCISPWNFPLAIFVGQVAAALVAGNSVIAKPAEQTPLIAARAVELFLKAGVPGDVLHLLPGDGAAVGGALVSDQRISGVAFTGSTETARLINQQLAMRDGPIVPFIAETGGLNVMLVDGTALPEQVVDDVITSAFQSAGQRCSALRVLYLQEDVADVVIDMLMGAMRELNIGDPSSLHTDIGPVIDQEAKHMLERHADRMTREARLLASCTLGDEHLDGHFVAPQVWEIEELSQLEKEVFGPVLHVIRFKISELPKVVNDINASGFGLTLGIHSRIDGFAREIFESTRVGNTYINRNMVGAVVGVNPFGGLGLSGTGPKAGGPNYLLRFAAEKTRTDNIVAKGGNTQLFTIDDAD